jgi:RNA polymerase sigma-70 factor, ECF subfamily
LDALAESVVVSSAWDAYRFELLAYLRRMGSHNQSAEDLLQESYARLMAEVRSGRAPLNTRAWLYAVARNLARSGGRRQRVAQLNRQRLAVRDSIQSAEELYVQRESDRFVSALLADVDPIDRMCLLMAAEGYGSAEIARAVASTDGAVRTRLHRVRRRLRARASAALEGGQLNTSTAGVQSHKN